VNSAQPNPWLDARLDLVIDLYEVPVTFILGWSGMVQGNSHYLVLAFLNAIVWGYGGFCGWYAVSATAESIQRRYRALHARK